MLFFMKSNNLAVIGPKSPVASAHIANMCDAKEIPFIDTYMDFDSKTTTINLYPSQDTLSRLLIDVVNKYEWKDFTILYEAPFYVKRISPILLERNSKQGIITIQPLEVGTNFRGVLKNVKNLGDRSRNIIIESSIDHLFEIMEQVKCCFFQIVDNF